MTQIQVGFQFNICSYCLKKSLGVVAATVNVLAELAPIRPQDCLVLAPQLFHILTTSSSNWVLIKIVKLVRIVPLLYPHFLNLVTSSVSYHLTNRGLSRNFNRPSQI